MPPPWEANKLVEVSPELVQALAREAIGENVRLGGDVKRDKPAIVLPAQLHNGFEEGVECIGGGPFFDQAVVEHKVVEVEWNVATDVIGTQAL